MSHVHILRDFYSHPEGFARTLRIYTPDAYDAEPDRRFPVLYMQDGQNVFNHPDSWLFHTWCANTTMDRLAAEGAIAPWIIVGIDHGHLRFEEYTPWDDHAVGVQGRGEAYADFVVHHVKPFIDGTYRTIPDSPATATMGASLGGLMALYMGWRFPHVFGRIGGVSPSLMWSQGGLFHAWRDHSRQWTRIYLDSGEHEWVRWAGTELDYGNTTRAFYHHLKSIGYADHELRLVLEPGANHHEVDWQRRLPEIFRWLLG